MTLKNGRMTLKDEIDIKDQLINVLKIKVKQLEYENGLLNISLNQNYINMLERYSSTGRAGGRTDYAGEIKGQAIAMGIGNPDPVDQ